MIEFVKAALDTLPASARITFTYTGGDRYTLRNAYATRTDMGNNLHGVEVENPYGTASYRDEGFLLRYVENVELWEGDTAVVDHGYHDHYHEACPLCH